MDSQRVGNANGDPDKGFCFGRENSTYVVYLPKDTEITLDLKNEKTDFQPHVV